MDEFGAPRPGQGGLPWRVRAGVFVRRHRLAPYLLLAPALAGVGWLIVWPTIQLGLFSFQNYGIEQLAGVAPAQWVGLANFTATFHDPEFWVSLRNSVGFAAIVVPLTLVTGTCVGLLLNRLGPRMSVVVSTTTLLAWATPTVAATVIFYWLFNPDGGVADWALAQLPGWLGGGAATWAGFNWMSSALPVYTVATLLLCLAGLPVHRGERARRAQDRAGRTARGREGGRRHPVAGVLEDHLPTAQTDLPGAAAPVGDLGLRGVHPALHTDRLAVPTWMSTTSCIYVYQRAFSIAAELRPGRRPGAGASPPSC